MPTPAVTATLLCRPGERVWREALPEISIVNKLTCAWTPAPPSTKLEWMTNEARDKALDEALWKFHQRNKHDRFFGTAELHYQGGQIVRIKKQETLTPQDLLRITDR